MEAMKKNYGSLADIEEEIKNVDIDNFLEFDYGGLYEFARCEGCYGPLLGHLEAKCKGKEGARYERETVRLFENYLKRIGGFKEAVWARQKKKREENEMIRLKEAEVMANKFADVIKLY